MVGLVAGTCPCNSYLVVLAGRDEPQGPCPTNISQHGTNKGTRQQVPSTCPFNSPKQLRIRVASRTDQMSVFATSVFDRTKICSSVTR